ncbi:MAG: hypothetical protein ACI9FN_000630 [Saprospiraceae bacterium]|jgi:hypothetical protein
MHLKHFIGVAKINNLLSFIDVGPYHEPEYHGPSVKDLREYTEIIRRLNIPFYEEARLYWNDAISDGFFDGANEGLIYSPDFLETLIKKYSQR